ncbi:MAG: methylmalonyl Co-A mutase-associated GTPase MeaB [Fidelibacterota bacterium]
MNPELLSRLRKNDIRTVSRLISRAENGDSSLDMDLDSLYPYTQEGVRIGMTGAPGVGKSTLIDTLVSHMRSDGKAVGVISVDPTSPFSGGALLGDRIRMTRHAADPNVFIRSMGSRGHPGGLARTTHLVADILACTGKDYVLVETIGVGQAETDIVQYVDLTIVVLVPESGDEIQIMKAGPVEVADLFVINKADREGADRIGSMLEEHISESLQKREIVPEVLRTTATKGEGVERLYEKCLQLVEAMKASGTFARRRKIQYLARVRNAVREELSRQFWNDAREEAVRGRVKQFMEEKVSPYEAARRIMEDLSSD